MMTNKDLVGEVLGSNMSGEAKKELIDLIYTSREIPADRKSRKKATKKAPDSEVKE